MNNEILYQSVEYSLINNGDELIFKVNNNLFYLISQPYEPCLYIKLDNKIITIIHNSFNTFEIVNIAKNNDEIRAITGKKYDIKGICELLICAINSNVYDTDISYLENQCKKNIEEMNEISYNESDNIKNKYIKNELNDVNFKELTEDIFYEEYKKYDECVLDYCIIKTEGNYNSFESHKDATIFAMKKWKKFAKYEYDLEISYYIEKMKATKLDTKDFFELCTKSYDKKNPSYCYLFLNPPHGCNYNVNDFEHINSILFPKGYDELEIFEWSTDWSNYFDEGLEWWGAKCVSIYDKSLHRFVVIGASATD